VKVGGRPVLLMNVLLSKPGALFCRLVLRSVWFDDGSSLPAGLCKDSYSLFGPLFSERSVQVQDGLGISISFCPLEFGEDWSSPHQSAASSDSR